MSLINFTGYMARMIYGEKKRDKTPFSNRYFKTSSRANCAASCKGLFISLLATSILNAGISKRSHRYLTTFILPARVATCSAVSPESECRKSHQSQIPCFATSVSTLCTFPLWHARKKVRDTLATSVVATLWDMPWEPRELYLTRRRTL